MEMDEDQQIDKNIENLQAYYNMLKEQGYSDGEINQIIQQELNYQQEAFLNSNQESDLNQRGYQDHNQDAYDQEEEQQLHINNNKNRMDGDSRDEKQQFPHQGKNNNRVNIKGEESHHQERETFKDYNNSVRQYDQDNFLIKPHQEEEEEDNNSSSNHFSSFAQQYQFSHKQSNNSSKQPNQIQNGMSCPQESFRGVLTEKNMSNIQNRRQSKEKQEDKNQLSYNLNKESISRGSISSSQKDDSMQQFAPLRSSERLPIQNVNQNTLKVNQNNQAKANNSILNQQQNNKQSIQPNNTLKYFKTNSAIQKNDENNFNTSTANFIRDSYKARTENKNSQIEHQKIQGRSRSKTPTKSQKPARVITTEEKQLLELKNKLRTVFTFYVSFGDRINVNYLKSNKFHKMMSDAQLKDNSVLTQNRLDLMFVKENHNKHNMDFDTFLNLIAKIAALKFPQYNEAQALQMILQNHFLPLYDNIMAETDLGEDELKFKETIDESPLIILKEVCPVLTLIYQHYFAFEWRNRGNEVQVKQKSESGIFQFLKEYDICPALITKSSGFLLYREILQMDNQELCRNSQLTDLSFFLSDDMGSFFTFWKFAIYLIRIGNICYSNLFNQLEQPPEGANRTAAEKFAFLLERMELSAGFQNLDKKNQSHQSLIIKKKMLNRMLSQGSIIGSSQISSINNQSSCNNSHTLHSLKNGIQIQQQNSGQISAQSSAIEGISNNNNMSNFDNGSIQSQNSISRINRSRSDLRLRQSASGLSEIQQQCIRNYSPMGFVNNSQKLNEQQKQVIIAHIQSMQNYKLFKNPLGLADIQCVENIALIDTYSDCLLTIFQTYCSFGDAMNTQWMKSTKFSKLMREANIINPNGVSISNNNNNNNNNSSSSTNLHSHSNQKTEESGKYLNVSDVDLIFIKASKKRSGHSISNATSLENTMKQQQRLDFEQFLVSLEMIAIKLFRDIGQFESMTILLNNYILPLSDNNGNAGSSENKSNNQCLSQIKSVHSSTSNEHVSILMDILKDQEVVELLGIIHKSMMVYYKHYSQNKNTVDFDKFVRFCKDFGIFPDIIPKQRLLRIFNTLAQIYNTTEMAQNASQSQSYNEKAVIDQHLFIEAIALCAFEVPYSDPQPNEIEKICYLVERMNQSGGQVMIQKQIGHTRSQSSNSGSWDMIQPIRKKYPHLFSYSNQSNNNYQNNSSQLSWSGSQHQVNTQKLLYANQSNVSKQNMFDDIMKRNLNLNCNQL